MNHAGRLLIWSAGVVLLAAPKAAEAQVQCTAMSEALLLQAFSDTAAPAGITPQTMRNLICSLFTSGAINTLIYNSSTGNAALPLGPQGEVLTGQGATPPAWQFQEKAMVKSWDSNVVVQNGTYPLLVADVPMQTVVDSVSVVTGGTSSPGFTIGLEIGATAVTGCSVVTVGTVESAATCSAANTLTPGNSLTLLVSGATGTPTTAGVQINYHVIP